MFLSQREQVHWNHFTLKRISEPDLRFVLPIVLRAIQNDAEDQPGAKEKAFVQRFKDCRT